MSIKLKSELKMCTNVCRAYNSRQQQYSPGIDDPHEARVVRVAKVTRQGEARERLPVEDLPAAPVRHPRDDGGELWGARNERSE